MSQRRLPPPDPAPCLARPYPSSQKGGTLIDERVTDRAEHRRRIRDPDGYRPAECPRCHHRGLHVHDHLARTSAPRARRPGGSCRRSWPGTCGVAGIPSRPTRSRHRRRRRCRKCPSAPSGGGVCAGEHRRSCCCSSSPRAGPHRSCASRPPSGTTAPAESSCAPTPPSQGRRRTTRSPPWQGSCTDSCRGSVSCDRGKLRACWDGRGEKNRSHREWPSSCRKTWP
jgi:hypothetical protein